MLGWRGVGGGPWREAIATIGTCSLGRTEELARIGALLDSARAGRAAALVLRGEPGIGKSTLLERAAEHADGLRVLRAVGVESVRE